MTMHKDGHDDSNVDRPLEDLASIRCNCDQLRRDIEDTMRHWVDGYEQDQTRMREMIEYLHRQQMAHLEQLYDSLWSSHVRRWWRDRTRPVRVFVYRVRAALEGRLNGDDE